jgi:hypothetical protein
LKEITNFWSDWNEISNKSLRWFSNRKKQCGFKNPVARIKDGDRNTCYYHVKTINRRRKNKIMMLKNDQNEWIEEEADLKEMVNNYYKNLFANTKRNIHWQQTRYTYPHISESDYDCLKKAISHMEVRDALFAMSPWKAPGLNGFPAGFYQNGWSDMGSSLCEFVKYIWSNPVDVATINFTDICLIPKVDRPEFVSQCRPISLCNVSYKIITKVMVNRLKNIIP